MEEYREQFEKEKGRTYLAEGCDYGSFNDEYVNCLEQQLKILNISVAIKRNLINIPENIIKEIESSILEHGVCGEIEFVKEMEEGLVEQGSELSFCSAEYFKQDLIKICDDDALGVVYFPWGFGYLKVPYTLQ